MEILNRWRTIDYRVIAPGEEIRFFHVNNGVIGNKLLANKVFTRTKYEICFCSIYGDCWTRKARTSWKLPVIRRGRADENLITTYVVAGYTVCFLCSA